MASKTTNSNAPCAKFKIVLDSLKLRLEEVLREKSHVVALQISLRGQKQTKELQRLLKERYKHLYACEQNCRAIHGFVCKQKARRKSSGLGAVSNTISNLGVAY